MAKFKEWKNAMDEMDCGVSVTVFISIFHFLIFCFSFLIFVLVPSSLIRCEFWRVARCLRYWTMFTYVHGQAIVTSGSLGWWLPKISWAFEFGYFHLL